MISEAEESTQTIREIKEVDKKKLCNKKKFSSQLLYK